MSQKNTAPSFYDIYNLSSERPLITNELYSPNDFYGHATILKEYVNLDTTKSIKAAIEHGIWGKRYFWENDLNAKLPALFVMASYRTSILQKITNKYLFKIGPLIAYAKDYLDNEEFKLEKNKLGRNLLVFPYHSTHHARAEFDKSKLLSEIDEIGKSFDSITICLYWKDILNGEAKDYLNRGYRCVTAGHIFDPLFLPRLRSIIKLSTLTISNGYGTHIGYSIFLGKPHYIVNSNLNIVPETRDNNILQDLLKEEKMEWKPHVQKIMSAFSDLRGEISKNQLEIVNYYWGLSEIKTHQEMKSIFIELEEIYNNVIPTLGSTLINLKELKSKIAARSLAIFGAGKYGQNSIEYFDSIGIKVKKIIDNDENKWKKKLNEIEIVSLDEVSKRYYFIVVSSSWHRQISLQLDKRGFKKEIDYILF